MKLAYAEAVVGLVRLYQRYTFRLTPGQVGASQCRIAPPPERRCNSVHLMAVNQIARKFVRDPGLELKTFQEVATHAGDEVARHVRRQLQAAVSVSQRGALSFTWGTCCPCCSSRRADSW